MFCRLLFVGLVMIVVYVFFVLCYALLFDVGCVLRFVVRCVLFVVWIVRVDCSLFVVCCLLVVVCCSLFVVCVSLFAVCCGLLVFRCLLFVVCCC